MPGINYFDKGMNSRRYAQARPNIHPTAIEEFRSFVGAGVKFARALDAGCGTGHSTIALSDIAGKVIGLDPSANMLSQTPAHPLVKYCQAAAENMPFSAANFDLVMAAQTFHWFEHAAFLSETKRILRDTGWLIIYTSWFTSEMREDPSFSQWINDKFLDRFPTPPRNRVAINNELTSKHSFRFRGEKEFSNQIPMTLETFIEFELSTTNVIAAIRQGKLGFDDAAKWMRASIAPFYSTHSERTFLFQGKLWILKKAA